MRQRPEISPIAATATAVWWMRSSGGKTAPSPRYAPGSSIERDHQAGVRLCQGALSRAQQEPPPPARDLRAGQFVHGAPPSIAPPTDVVSLTSPLTVADAADLTPNNDPPAPTLSLANA